MSEAISYTELMQTFEKLKKNTLEQYKLKLFEFKLLSQLLAQYDIVFNMLDELETFIEYGAIGKQSRG